MTRIGDRDPAAPLDPAAQELLEAAGAEQRRIVSHRQRGEPSLWLALRLVGGVGWTVVLPAVAGGYAGRYLDRCLGWPPTWAWLLAAVGIVFGCFAAWRLVRGSFAALDD